MEGTRSYSAHRKRLSLRGDTTKIFSQRNSSTLSRGKAWCDFCTGEISLCFTQKFSTGRKDRKKFPRSMVFDESPIIADGNLRCDVASPHSAEVNALLFPPPTLLDQVILDRVLLTS